MTSGGGWNKFQAATFSCVDALRLSKLHNLTDLQNQEYIISYIYIFLKKEAKRIMKIEESYIHCCGRMRREKEQ